MKISQAHAIGTMATTSGKRSNAVKRASSAAIHTAGSLTSAVNSAEIPTSGYMKSGVVINTKEDTGEWNGNAMAIAGEDLDSLSTAALEIETTMSRSWLAFLVDPSIRTGRIMILIAAAIYGTNFATVKLLDGSIPLSISASFRFGVASIVLSALVIGKEKDDVDPMIKKERNLAYWSGAEVGIWHGVAYLAQAEALHTIAAGKVSKLQYQ
mmetsp:Transcript_7017/g.14944  ORF Transcript_7017/g.14944 Transcript_7017/m.14944 type:complete len:211 (-) Transcript_7017:238-870(-)